MTRSFTAGVVGAVVAVAVLIPAWVLQSMQARRLAAEVDRLRVQATEAQSQAETQNQKAAVKRGPQPSEEEIQRWQKSHEEVLRLRSQVTRLSRENGELREKLNLPAPPARTAAPPRPEPVVAPAPPPAAAPDSAGLRVGVFTPADAWANAGFATPEAALQTVQWAMHTGNDAVLLKGSLAVSLDQAGDAMVVAGGDAVQVSTGMLLRSEDPAGGEVVIDALPDLQGSTVLAREQIDPDTVAFTIQNRHADGTVLEMPMTFTREGAEWRLMPTLVEGLDDSGQP